MGGDTRAEVTAVVDSLATAYAAVPVTVVAGDVTVSSTAGALGLSVDEPATVKAVMDHGENGFPVGRFFRWVWSYVSDADVAPPVVVDDSVATAEVNRLLAGKTGGPVEPSFAQQGGQLVAVAGHPGLGIETADVVAGLHSFGVLEEGHEGRGREPHRAAEVLRRRRAEARRRGERAHLEADRGQGG